jgi:hypothetical protein
VNADTNPNTCKILYSKTSKTLLANENKDKFKHC